MDFENFQGAHHVLVIETERARLRPESNLIPVSLVSVNDTIEGQLILFDNQKHSPSEIVKRLRLAADFIESKIN